jgi:hypothetical protein
MPAPAARADFRRHLVPAVPAPLDADFVLVDDRIVRGLPHAIPLTGEFSLLLVLPTGLATAWRDASPTAVVTSSQEQTTPRPSTEPVEPLPVTAPARLVVRRQGAIAGSVALAAGCRVVIPETDPDSGVRIEVVVREWDVRAGSMRGPGDVGSRIALAWRRIDQGTAVFERRRP